jgi:Nif-specific regulatory protein
MGIVVDRNVELEVLNQISQALVHHKDVSALLHEVWDILDHELGMQRGTLTLRRADSNILGIEASKGLTPEEAKLGQYKIGEGVTGLVAKTGVPELVPDIRKDRRFLDRTGARGDAELAFICVPIVHKDEIIGTISIDIDRPSSDSALLDRDLNLLKVISNILAEAVSGIRAQVEERESLLRENRKLRAELVEQYRPSSIVGNCTSMRGIYKLIGQVADSPATVLVRGESGTGKELVARALHYGSKRKNQPFIDVNCAALPEGLVESELFGHEKGSFTGALRQRKGRFELADGGTIFLDEIGDVPLHVQVRLLRVLQERKFERVGGHDTIKVNVRNVAATSRNLEKLMTEEKFREDLYFRLNVFPIHLPPLRERRPDIVQLADHFLSVYNEKYARSIKRISTPAINMMMSYHWPGNVRELENCIEHACITTADAVIHGYNLPPSLQTATETHTQLTIGPDVSLETAVNSFERELIVEHLKDSRGNCAGAARALQTTQRKLLYRIKRLNITPRDYRS